MKFQKRQLDGETGKYTDSFKSTDMADLAKQTEAVTAKIAELTQTQGQAR